MKYFLSDGDEIHLSVLIFHGAFIIACIINILAALRIIKWLLLPYIGLDFVRLTVFFACHVVLTMIYKKQLDLGVLIAVCCLGGFFLLFLFYMWSCSIALFQMISVVSTKKYKGLQFGNSSAATAVKTVNTISDNVKLKPPMGDRADKIVGGGIFASDFSGFNRKQNMKI